MLNSIGIGMPATLLAEYTQQTEFGSMTLGAYFADDYVVVCVKAEWIGEWAGNDSLNGEFWETVNPYAWEDYDEFPETTDEFTEYLIYCARVIVKQLSQRLSSAAAVLLAEGDRYYKQHKVSPPSDWLLERYPQKPLSTATAKFKQRVIAAVLQQFSQQAQQLSLLKEHYYE